MRVSSLVSNKNQSSDHISHDGSSDDDSSASRRSVLLEESSHQVFSRLYQDLAENQAKDAV